MSPRNVLLRIIPSSLRNAKRTLFDEFYQYRDDYWVRRLSSTSNAISKRARDHYEVARLRYRPARRITFFPELPAEMSVMRKLCLRLGFGVTTDLKADTLATFKWCDQTVFDPTVYFSPQADRTCFNLHCTDISKGHVAEVFAEVFGYDLAVDPTIHDGLILKKSEINAAHDGQVLQGPLSHRTSGFSFQRLIDNQVSNRFFLDSRVPVFGGRLPFVYFKLRDIDTRFESYIPHAVVTETDNVFSAEEQERLVEFTRRMGLDYGELDVLRDRTDDRIYVVDCNNTPSGPPKALCSSDMTYALTTMAEELERLLTTTPLPAPSASHNVLT